MNLSTLGLKAPEERKTMVENTSDFTTQDNISSDKSTTPQECDTKISDLHLQIASHSTSTTCTNINITPV